MPADGARPPAGFEVRPWVDAFGGFVERRRNLWIRLGDFETRMLADSLAAIRIEAPIYIAGLARSGSTVLLEMLARHGATASHRYRDYPPVFTPYFWNWVLDRTKRRAAPAAERTHGDGIRVTPESPEAFEEMLWMAFFPHLHDPGRSAVLEARSENAGFERFYRDHIRKLIKLRGGRRYLSKGNYNLTRLSYLRKLFPDARFVIPVREPLWHIASLMKQHALFCEGERANPAALRHMRRVGHFEFGLDRRPVNAGDDDAIAAIDRAWAAGREVEGWARYWAHLHGHVADRLAADAGLREASLVVRFEDVCNLPHETIRGVFDHCRLDLSAETLAGLAAPIRFPSYYAPRFTAAERSTIERFAGEAAVRFGYGGGPERI